MARETESEESKHAEERKINSEGLWFDRVRLSVLQQREKTETRMQIWRPR